MNYLKHTQRARRNCKELKESRKPHNEKKLKERENQTQTWEMTNHLLKQNFTERINSRFGKEEKSTYLKKVQIELYSPKN